MKSRQSPGKDLSPSDTQLEREVSALYALLSNAYGPDRLVLKAGKMDALQLMRSPSIEDRILALQRLVYEDPTIDELPVESEFAELLNSLEEEIAEVMARQTVEEAVERKVAERMQKRHEEYLKEIRLQVLKEEGGSSDNPQTLMRYAELEKLEQVSLARSVLERLRPQKVQDVIGQGEAVTALFSKIASPYPQHVILYGPPGVGKTTLARLALEEAKSRAHTPFSQEAAFVEVDGTTLRWDPREVTNPLLGSVHDPIYQGAKRELAEGGVPEPKPGLVTEAHGGVLFIDEIGELDPMLQAKLLKVMEDKRVKFDSSYYDPSDPQVPKYIKKLFDEGAPADFLLIGATTRGPEEISPALRSRCAEVFLDPLGPSQVAEIVRQAALRIEVNLEEGVAQQISEYTVEGRKAIRILADAYGIALYRQDDPGHVCITSGDVAQVVTTGRITPYIQAKASHTPEVGKVFGLGVSGFMGSLIEIESVVFPAQAGKGKMRFNETAGSMAKDSVFNAASVIRRLTGKDLSDYDVHVNVIGGGRIDGPSAGTAIVTAIYSALEDRPLRQDVALTGEVSIRGKVKAVGGVHEKLHGARQAGIRKVLLSQENAKDLPQDLGGLEVVLIEDVQEALEHVLAVQ